jgi:hypothetical protein
MVSSGAGVSWVFCLGCRAGRASHFWLRLVFLKWSWGLVVCVCVWGRVPCRCSGETVVFFLSSELCFGGGVSFRLVCWLPGSGSGGAIGEGRGGFFLFLASR